MKINTGFEFETQAMSMSVVSSSPQQSRTVDDDDAAITIVVSPSAFYKKTLLQSTSEAKRVQVYPDDIKTTTAFYMNTLSPFLSRIGDGRAPTKIRLCATTSLPSQHHDYYTIDSQPSSLLRDVFNHTEFIVTYPSDDDIPEPVTEQKILAYLLEKTKDAVLDIQNTLKSKGFFKNTASGVKVVAVSPKQNGAPPPSFPYPWVSSLPEKGIVFFSQFDPSMFMSRFRFVAQTTIGVGLFDAPRIMTILTKAFTRAGGSTEYDILGRVGEYTSVFTSREYRKLWRTPLQTLRPFLFLLFYSALTSSRRKSSALFVIRCTMFELAQREIAPDDIELLQLVLLGDDYFHDPVAIYIGKILKDFSPSSSSSSTTTARRIAQNLLDVTTIPYTGQTVYIEFRGFTTVLKSWCRPDAEDPRKTNLYMHDILACKAPCHHHHPSRSR